MLEGLEVEKNYDGGKLIVDADDKGTIKISNVYSKDLDGFVKVSATLEVESNIFNIAEKIAAKTGTTWDDTAVAAIKNLLGIK